METSEGIFIHPIMMIDSILKPKCIFQDDVSLLVIILDTNPIFWGEKSIHSFLNSSNNNNNNNSRNESQHHIQESNVVFGTFLQQLFVFLNAYLMIKHQNILSIIANHIG